MKVQNKKVILIGPPGSGKSTLSPLLAKKLGVPHLRTNAVLQREARAGTPEGIEYDEWRKKYKPPENKGKVIPGPHIRAPAHMFINVFLKHYQDSDGWILERGPKQPSYFDLYKNAGIYPDKVICLVLDEEISLKRIQNRRLDPVTAKVYNLELSPPQDESILQRLVKRDDDQQEEYVRSRLKRFQEEGMTVVSMFPKEIVKYIDANQPLETILDEILLFFQ